MQNKIQNRGRLISAKIDWLGTTAHLQDAASKDGDWLFIGKFAESAEWSNRNYSAIYDCRMIVLFQL